MENSECERSTEWQQLASKISKDAGKHPECQYAYRSLKAWSTVAGVVCQAIGVELSNITSNKFRNRDSFVDKELRAPGGIGNRGGHGVDADIVI